MSTGVLVPIKAFVAAKGRLDGALDGAQRADLSRRLAAGVLAAAAPHPTWVVCDDDEVAAFAATAGASVVRQPAPGLNPGVQHAVDHLAGLGVAVVVVAHADLPEPGGLGAVAGAAGPELVVLVADRHGEGTNVLAVPASAGFRFAYGPGSAAAHRAEAARLGLPVRDVFDEGLGWDVDVPDDLDQRAWPTTTSPPAHRSA